MKKFNFLSALTSMLSIKAKAEITTATSSSEGGVKFDEATRLVYAKEIEFKALPLMRFMQFAQTRTELGVEAGLTISMLTYDNLKMGGKLDEMKDLVTQSLSGQTKQITVSEHGNAVAVTELLLRSSFDDIMASATTLLSRDYALVIDCELRDVALSNDSNIVYAGKKDSRTSITADDILQVSTVKDAIEILATNNAPKFGANWICFVHPHQSRSLRDDSAWINASNYGAPEQLFTGEIGRIDDTRFVETTLMCNGAAPEDDPAYNKELKKGYSSSGGSIATDIYQAVIFGDAYFGIATSLPVELRDNGVEDFGRKHSLAWYAIFGTGLLHKDYGVVIETA